MWGGCTIYLYTCTCIYQLLYKVYLRPILGTHIVHDVDDSVIDDAAHSLQTMWSDDVQQAWWETEAEEDRSDGKTLKHLYTHTCIVII